MNPFKSRGRTGVVLALTAALAVPLISSAEPERAEATAPASALCNNNNAFCGYTLHVKNGTTTVMPSKSFGAHYGPGWDMPSGANNSTGVGYCLDDTFWGVPVGTVSEVPVPSGWSQAGIREAAYILAMFAGDRVVPYQPIPIDGDGEFVGFTTRQRHLAVHLALHSVVPNLNPNGSYAPLFDPATMQLFSNAAGTTLSPQQVVVPLVQQIVAAAQAHRASGSNLVLDAVLTAPGVVTVTVTRDGQPVANLPVFPPNPTGITPVASSGVAHDNAVAAGWPRLDYQGSRAAATTTNAAGQAVFNIAPSVTSAQFNTEEAPSAVHQFSDLQNSQGNLTWFASEIRSANDVLQMTVPLPTVITQISDQNAALGETITDSITISDLPTGATADVQLQLFDLDVDPDGTGTPLVDVTITGLSNGTTTGHAPYTVTANEAGHRLGYRERVVAVSFSPAPTLPGPWSDLGIANESTDTTGTLVTSAAAVTNGITPNIGADGFPEPAMGAIIPGSSSLWDSVEYQLGSGTYTITATVMEVTGSGAGRTCTATDIVATQTFTADGGEGSVLVGPLVIPAVPGSFDEGAVIFERTVNGDGRVVAAHEDCADDRQFVPGIAPDGWTNASVTDPAPLAAATAEFPGLDFEAAGLAGTSLVDTFTFENFAPGTYTLTVNWQERNGDECTASGYVSTITFDVTDPNGSVTTDPIPTTLADAGKVFVGFETVTPADDTSLVVVEHSDCNNGDETVAIVTPDGYTNASVAHQAPAAMASAQFPGLDFEAAGLAGTSLIDTFTYENLIDGTYTLTVNWQVRNGNVCTASGYVSTITFDVTDPNGSVTTAPIPTSLADAGKVFVGFETLTPADDTSLVVVEHSDCNNGDETVAIVTPRITTATNATRTPGTTNWDDGMVTGVAPGVSYTIRLNVYRLVPGNSQGITAQTVCSSTPAIHTINYTATGSGTFRSPTYTIPANEVAGVQYVHREHIVFGGQVLASEACGVASEITTITRTRSSGGLITTK